VHDAPGEPYRDLAVEDILQEDVPALYIVWLLVTQQRGVEMLPEHLAPRPCEGGSGPRREHLRERLKGRQDLPHGMALDLSVAHRIRRSLVVGLDLNDVDDERAVLFAEAEQVRLLSGVIASDEPSRRGRCVEADGEAAGLLVPVPAYGDELAERSLNLLVLARRRQAKDSVRLHRHEVAHQALERLWLC
jgi:hypothetical protein